MNAPRIGWIPSSRDMRVASARLRCALPCRYLRDAGWEAELFDERRAGSYDLVVFQKIYDRRRLELASTLRGAGVKTVFDLCDDHFYNPDRLPELEERARRLEEMLDLVDAVSVATPVLARLVADRVPTVVDDALDEMAHRPPARRRPSLPRRSRRTDELRLVWYGNAGMKSPPFGLVHLPKVIPALERLNGQRPLCLTVISNSRPAYEDALAGASFSHGYREWELRSFAHLFAQNDLCIIPIEQNPFTLGKTANRVVLSLRLGVPVVADPIPSFDEFAPFILLDEWDASLVRYATDPDLRARHVRAGREYVQATYTPARVVAQWGGFFRRVLNYEPRPRGTVEGTVAR
jgi:hypothetical protein